MVDVASLVDGPQVFVTILHREKAIFFNHKYVNLTVAASKGLFVLVT